MSKSFLGKFLSREKSKKKKNKIIIVLFYFLAVFGCTYLFYHLNRSKNFNIIFINLDALRPDHLGCYGYPRNTSPNIDKLAEEGVMFTQAISQSSYTPTAIHSIFSSAYPYMHGVYDFGQPNNPRLKTLSGVLKGNGYYLGLISGRGRLAEFSFPGLMREFNTVYPPDSTYLSAKEVTDEAIRWINSNGRRKFFLWLYYLEPHAPYRAPEPYSKLFMDDELRKKNEKNIPLSDSINDRYDGRGVIPRVAAVKGETEVGYYISRYDGEIRFADEQIGRIVKELKEAGISNRTLIIITSDHGEFIGEHDFYFVHSVALYDPVIRVPLIFKLPGVLPRGEIIGAQVGHIDILPTVIQLLGIKPSPGSSGRNLYPAFFKSKAHDPRDIFSELVDGNNGLLISLRAGDWKLIYTSLNDAYELYDLKTDPQESVNLAAGQPGIFASLKERMDSYRNMQRLSNNQGKGSSLDDGAKEKLKSLGYL